MENNKDSLPNGRQKAEKGNYAWETVQHEETWQGKGHTETELVFSTSKSLVFGIVVHVHTTHTHTACLGNLKASREGNGSWRVFPVN